MLSPPQLHAAVIFPNHNLHLFYTLTNILSRIDLSYKSICAPWQAHANKSMHERMLRNAHNYTYDGWRLMDSARKTFRQTSETKSL